MNDTQFKLRLKDDLLESLKEEAKANGRSVNKELEAILAIYPFASKGIVKTQIRLPTDMHRFLRGASFESGQSLNSLMVAMIRKGIEGDDEDGN